MNTGFIDPSTLAALVFDCGRLGQRKEGQEARHRRRVALEFQVPRTQRLGELAAAAVGV
jgi:hypothetical protein